MTQPSRTISEAKCRLHELRRAWERGWLNQAYYEVRYLELENERIAERDLDMNTISEAELRRLLEKHFMQYWHRTSMTFAINACLAEYSKLAEPPCVNCGNPRWWHSEDTTGICEGFSEE